MRTLIQKALLFALTSLAAYVGLFILLYRIELKGTPLIYRTTFGLVLKGGQTWQTFREFQPDSTYDVVVLGSSHAYRGYDPRIFGQQGLKMHNLGTGGASIYNTRYIAENYLRSGTARLVILDIFDSPFRADGLESSADLIQNLPSDRAAIQTAWALRDIRGINMLTLRILSRDAAPAYLDSSYVQGGFVERHDSLQAPQLIRSQEMNLRQDQLRHFEALLDYLQAQRLPVVVVTHPAPHAYSRESQDQFREIIRPIVDRHGIRWLDYATDHGLDDQYHFYDYNHLNQAGTTLFNVRLLEDLRQAGLIPVVSPEMHMP